MSPQPRRRSSGPTTSSSDNLWAERGTVFLTGTQALVRLLLMQRARDAAARLEHAGLRQRLPRLAAGHGRPGDLEGGPTLHRRRHPFRAGDQRGTRPRRRCSAPSASSPTPSAPSTACSRCGTARARASTAPATRSSTATPTAARRTAACWWWRATTMAASRRRCRTRATCLFQAFHMPIVRAGQRGRVPRVRPVRLGAVALLGQLGRR